MRRFTPKHGLLILLAAAFSLGWTTEERPVGDTQTVTRGDVTIADEASTIHVYRENDGTFERVESFETNPQATHERRRRDRKHRHGTFACSCSHVHRHDDYHDDCCYDDCCYDDCCRADWVVTGSFMVYVQDRSVVVVVDIEVPDEPVELSRTNMGWTIESIAVGDDVVIIEGGEATMQFDPSNPDGTMREVRSN